MYSMYYDAASVLRLVREVEGAKMSIGSICERCEASLELRQNNSERGKSYMTIRICHESVLMSEAVVAISH